MSESISLSEISIEGFRSIESLSLQLSSNVTVLIGANGAGKSSLIGAFELIARIWDGSFRSYLDDRGGLSSLTHVSDMTESESIRLTVWSASGHLRNGYRAELNADDDDEAVLHEWLLFQDTEQYDKPYDELVGKGSTSRARVLSESSEDSRLRRFVRYVEPMLAGCRVFHFDDVGLSSPAKGWSTVGDDLWLRSNAENIAAYLLRVKVDDRLAYQRIVAAIQMVAPFFEDFILVPNKSERIRLRWRQQGTDRVFLGREMSDGTLRFVCLATLLLGPDRPSTIVLDEPELGLHPFAIQQLSELARASATQGHRVVMATQSVPLLAHFDVGEAVVLERHEGATVATRPDEEALGAFLEEYSLGSLWEMNLLGGRPNHSEGRR